MKKLIATIMMTMVFLSVGVTVFASEKASIEINVTAYDSKIDSEEKYTSYESNDESKKVKSPVVKVSGYALDFSVTVESDVEIDSFEITEDDVLVAGGYAIPKITKRSSNRYDISFAPQEFKNITFKIQEGVAKDVYGNISEESEQAVIDASKETLQKLYDNTKNVIEVEDKSVESEKPVIQMGAVRSSCDTDGACEYVYSIEVVGDNIENFEITEEDVIGIPDTVEMKLDKVSKNTYYLKLKWNCTLDESFYIKEGVAKDTNGNISEQSGVLNIHSVKPEKSFDMSTLLLALIMLVAFIILLVEIYEETKIAKKCDDEKKIEKEDEKTGE